MTSFHFAEYLLLALQAAAWLAAGMLVGAFHFLTLRWNVRMLAAGRARFPSIITLFGRFALLAGVLWIVTDHLGALPLLLTSAGILAARTAVMRWGPPP